jgi:poly(A) polymerase
MAATNLPSGDMSKLMQQFALETVKRLREAGYSALYAGGCVRDMLLGSTPHDYDVATDAAPEQVQKLFRRSLAIGAQFGVIEVLGREPGLHVQIATFRSDGHYSDGRHPDSVKYGTAEEDAQRRDFTINGLFYDPLDEKVIDYVGGQADLQKRILRAIGDPYKRFEEDKLRMLRAVRFASRLMFELEDNTAHAIRKMKDQLHQVSTERITDELKKMLTHRTRVLTMMRLRHLQLMPVLLPRMRKYDEEYLLVAHLPAEVSFPLVWAALLLNLQNINHGEALLTRQEVQQHYGRSFRLSLEDIDHVLYLIEGLPELRHADQLSWSKLKPLLAHQYRDELLVLLHAACNAWRWDVAGFQYCVKQLKHWSQADLEPPVLVTGEDVAALGVPKGPAYKTLLTAIREAQLNEEVKDRDAALELLRSIVPISLRRDG